MIGFSAAVRFLMDDVREFHQMCGSTDPTEPQTEPDASKVRLRGKLILEECIETLGGMFDYGTREGLKARIAAACSELDVAAVRFNIEEVADGLADLIYVCVGAALAFGVPLDRVWAEVQRANMDKEGGGRSAAGKVLKPVGWIPPRIYEAIFGEAA